MNKEEAVKQCNDLINDFKNGNGLDIRVNATDIRAIETVIKEYQKIEKANDRLLVLCADYKINYISKDKIREKIKEYSLDNLTINMCGRGQGKTFQQVVRTEINKVLQELLEGE